MANTLTGEQKVFEFMDEVNRDRENIAAMNAFKNSEAYKRKCLNKGISDAKDSCLSYIFNDLYAKSLPLDPIYKDLHREDLEKDMQDFINQQTADKGYTVYVKEAIKRGNPTMKRLMERVDDYVNRIYLEKSVNLKSLTPEDLNFQMNSDDKKEMEAISQDLELDDVAKIIQNNVKRTADLEVQRSKEEKEEEENLEQILSQDNEITEESAIDTVLAIKNAKKNRIYQPSLFEGIMIGKFAHATMESADDQYEVFCEAVREFTLHNIRKALKLDTYNKNSIQKLALKYANS